MAGVQISPDSTRMTGAVIAGTATNTLSLIAAVTGKVIRVYRIFMNNAAASTVTFLDGTTAISGTITLAAGNNLTLDTTGDPWFTTSAGNAFQITNTNSSLVGGVIYFTQVQP